MFAPRSLAITCSVTRGSSLQTFLVFYFYYIYLRDGGIVNKNVKMFLKHETKNIFK